MKLMKKVLKDITASLSEKAQQHINNFTSALENDLATPKALSILQKVIKDSSLDAKECVTLIKLMDSVLGLRLIEKASIILQTQEKAASVNPHEGDEEAPEIEALIAERNAAKAAKNYGRADEIRNELNNRGIELTDTPNGTVWARK